MHVKEEHSTVQEDGRNQLFFIFCFLQGGEKKLLCCDIPLLGGKQKKKKNKPPQKQARKKTPTPYTQKTQKIRTRYINTECSETFIFANRGSAFSQACLQDLVSLENKNIWGVMVNKSIFKCMILKQKNICFVSHKFHAVSPCCASEWTEQYLLKYATSEFCLCKQETRWGMLTNLIPLIFAGFAFPTANSNNSRTVFFKSLTEEKN